LAGGKLRAGVGARIINPPLNSPMAGFFARTGGAIGVHDDLMAKAFVLEDEKCACAIVCLDIIHITLPRTQRIRSLVNRVTGIPVENIMISTSHNHSGPDLDAPGCGEWAPHFETQVADAVCEAWPCREDASLGVGIGTVTGIGVNRRGKNSMDNSVGVLRVGRSDGRLLAILVNYTCHAVVLGPDNRLISADYPGYAQRYVKDMLGCEDVVVLFTNGAAGDINTGYSADASAIGGFIPGRTFERADALGKRLAGAVIETLMTIKESEGVVIDVVACPWEARYRKDLPTPEDTMERITRLTRRLDELKNENSGDAGSVQLDLICQKIILDNLTEINNSPTGKRLTETQGIRVGDAVYVSLPGEVFVELGLNIKAKSPFPYTITVGYANDYIGYVPTKEAFLEGGYEVSVSKFPPDIGEELKEAAISCLRRLHDRGAKGVLP
jgi:neutral ceramidase